MDSHHTQVIEILSKKLGRDISVFDESFLAKSLEKRQAVTERFNPNEYLQFLSGDNNEAEAFLQSLGITYSEFFRSPLAFALMEQMVLPSLFEELEKANRAEVRAWSAGCAAGQEAYSIAMLLDELAAAKGDHLSFRIFATDISLAELDKGREGVYDRTAIQNVSLKRFHHYFTQKGENYTIKTRIRDRIDFSFFDLLDPDSGSPPASIFGDFDLVTCSNLLFYYRQNVRQFILSKIYHSLSSRGCLVVGEAERGIMENTNFFRAIAPPAAIYQKVLR